MAFRRSYKGRRGRGRRTKRVVQRVVNSRLPYKSYAQYRPSQLACVRTFDLTAIGGLTGGPDQLGLMSFNLGQVPGTTELQNMFDRYRICGIAFRWVLRNNPDIQGAVLGNNVRVIHAIDVTGGTTPSTLTDLRQYNGIKETNLSSDRTVGRWFFFRPKALIANTFSVAKWIPTAVPNQAHFGVQYCVNNLQQSTVIIPEIKMYLTLRNML